MGDSPERRRIWLEGLMSRRNEKQRLRGARHGYIRKGRHRKLVTLFAKRKQEFLERKFDLEEIVITRPRHVPRPKRQTIGNQEGRGEIGRGAAVNA